MISSAGQTLILSVASTTRAPHVMSTDWQSEMDTPEKTDTLPLETLTVRLSWTRLRQQNLIYDLFTARGDDGDGRSLSEDEGWTMLPCFLFQVHPHSLSELPLNTQAGDDEGRG